MDTMYDPNRPSERRFNLDPLRTGPKEKFTCGVPRRRSVPASSPKRGGLGWVFVLATLFLVAIMALAYLRGTAHAADDWGLAVDRGHGSSIERTFQNHEDCAFARNRVTWQEDVKAAKCDLFLSGAVVQPKGSPVQAVQPVGSPIDDDPKAKAAAASKAFCVESGGIWDGYGGCVGEGNKWKLGNQGRSAPVFVPRGGGKR